MRGKCIPVRTAALALLGLMWIGRGLVILDDPGSSDPDEAIIHHLIPVWIRVTAWVSTGVVALATAWHPRAAPVGWAVILLMPAERAVSYGWSLAMWLIPAGASGTSWAAPYLLWWASTTALLIIMSRWREPNA